MPLIVLWIDAMFMDVLKTRTFGPKIEFASMGGATGTGGENSHPVKKSANKQTNEIRNAFFIKTPIMSNILYLRPFCKLSIKPADRNLFAGKYIPLNSIKIRSKRDPY
jgi:hypothetical protein